MRTSHDYLRFLPYATVASLPWIVGPIIALAALWTPNPSVEDQLLELGFADLLEEDEGDDELDRFVTLPASFTFPIDAPEGEPEPEPVQPEPAPQPPIVKTAGAAPALAVAVADGAPALAIGDAGDGSPREERAEDGQRAKRPAKARRGRRCSAPNPAIRTGGDGVLEIDRSLVDHYTKNLEAFMSLGYSHPHDEGDVHGWYISGFGCTSPVAKAGFKRGDVILTVNGKKTRTWVGVYLLYQKLKKKDDFVVELVRKGEPVTLRFRVVPS